MIPTEQNAENIAALLSPAEARELLAVAATNGGGVYVGSVASKPRTRTILRLHLMGLVQGKKGEQCSAVHTKEGLAVARVLRGRKP
ncbi:hypothetical protein UFOVP747_47 [uncultured Caudovirales phage]|uniref:Uncharacterized protein n=1 Tax=uncultured Caudovirales phage TaxID=2100421 RepID=A0A6J5NP14_9CAUD|nr:hypothetical protein UFOVP675_52 [uncultured Caudovirales phage]CAB5225561.1 hypothetical protein UFOVP747_47 [uncultured Caudovirales phage]